MLDELFEFWVHNSFPKEKQYVPFLLLLLLFSSSSIKIQNWSIKINVIVIQNLIIIQWGLISLGGI